MAEIMEDLGLEYEEKSHARLKKDFDLLVGGEHAMETRGRSQLLSLIIKR